jgi:hypothetical protein
MSPQDTFQIERALQEPTPRRVRYTATTQATRRVVVTAFFGLLGVFLWLATADVRQMAEVAAHGRKVMAPIVEREEIRKQSSMYYLILDLVTDDGQHQRLEEEVDEDIYKSAKVGDKRVVTYMPSAPFIYYFGTVDASSVEGERIGWTVGILIGAALCLLGLTVYEANLRGKARLLRVGLPVRGEIIAKREVKSSAWKTSPRRTLYELEYRYPSPGALRVQDPTQTVTVSRSVFYRLDVGMAFSVLVDPDDIFHSAPYLLLTEVEIEGAVPRSFPST